jgi:hypothetical protein
MKLVYCEWYDSYSEDEWTDYSTIELHMPTIISCGLLVKEDEDVLTLGLNYDHHDNDPLWSCFIMIPKICIKERKDVPINEIRSYNVTNLRDRIND